MLSHFSDGGESSQQDTPTRAPTVFLVDDDPHTVALVSHILEREGYKVDSATDGKSALAKIKSDPSKYDVVISDYSMSEITGKELIATLKRTGFHGKTVIYSGHVAKDNEAWRKSLGADAVIPKLGTSALLASLGKLTKWN
jgi:CheY-like chemotaxis protein